MSSFPTSIGDALNSATFQLNQFFDDLKPTEIGMSELIKVGTLVSLIACTVLMARREPNVELSVVSDLSKKIKNLTTALRRTTGQSERLVQALDQAVDQNKLLVRALEQRERNEEALVRRLLTLPSSNGEAEPGDAAATSIPPSQVYDAVRNKDLGQLEQILDQNADVSNCSSSGENLLHLIANFGWVTGLSAFRRREVKFTDFTQKTTSGKTPLHCAKHNFLLFNLLLDFARETAPDGDIHSLFEIKDKKGRNILHENEFSIDELLKHFAHMKEIMREPGRNSTPFDELVTKIWKAKAKSNSTLPQEYVILLNDHGYCPTEILQILLLNYLAANPDIQTNSTKPRVSNTKKWIEEILRIAQDDDASPRDSTPPVNQLLAVNQLLETAGFSIS